MAHSAEDCGLILQAIAGHDPRDPSSAPGGFKFQPRALAKRKFRLGMLLTDYKKDKAPEAEKRFGDALAVFRKLGHSAKEMKLPNFPYDLAAGTIVDVEIVCEPLAFQDRDALLVAASDINDRVRAEAALAASEERYRATFEETSASSMPWSSSVSISCATSSGASGEVR